jgi:hypothetical protein
MHALRWSLIAFIVAAWPGAYALGAAVPTETITAPDTSSGDNAEVPPDAPPDTNVPPDSGDTPDDATTPDATTPDSTAPDSTAPDAAATDVLPTIEYDFDKLPLPVKRLREQIIEAASTGDPEKLRTIIEAQSEPPDFGPSETGDPIGYLKLQSGDADGREILAILIEVLEAGYVHVDAGTPDEVYLWPYFARYPIDQLTPPQLVQLFKLVYAGDYEDMLANGVYDYFRAGISPDGEWKFFNAGD